MNDGAETMKRTVFLATILCSGFLLFAQENVQASSGDVSSDYLLGEDGRIRQRIVWTRANAYFYEIEMEKLGPGAVWALERKDRTEQNFLEFSLTPGMYRYRILNYNVLGRVGAVSEWAGLRVFVAKRPAAEAVSPAAHFVDSPEAEFTLTVTGRDLVEGAQMYIAPRGKETRPVPASSITYSPNETSIRAAFQAAGLELGAYNIVITNPGGIEQALEGFSVGFSRPLDINVSGGYAPVFPLYGFLFDSYNAAVYPLGFYGRVSIVPVKRLWGWIGFELNPRYADMKTENSAYTLTGGMTILDADLLLQKWMRNYTMAINLRLGGGIAAVSNIEFSHRDGSRSEKTGTTLFAINAGASFQWVPWKHLCLEAGLEYTHLASAQSPGTGLLRISIAAGNTF
jgi:hypothetical protein